MKSVVISVQSREPYLTFKTNKSVNLVNILHLKYQPRVLLRVLLESRNIILSRNNYKQIKHYTVINQ